MRQDIQKAQLARVAVSLATLLLAALFLAAPAVSQLEILTADDTGGGGSSDGPFGDKPCDCYFDSDCPELKGCDIGTPMCLNEGKLDGLCLVWQSPNDLEGESDFDALARLRAEIERYFGLYEPIVSSGGEGKPSEDEAASFGAISGEDLVVEPLCEPPCVLLKRRIYLLRVLNNAMERAFGYDYNIGPLQQFGNLRHVPDVQAAGALLRAVRQAFDQALAQRNPQAVRGPLASFWQQYPNYYPRHSGRCYPHGHAGDLPPLECQTLALRKMVRGMLVSLPSALP